MKTFEQLTFSQKMSAIRIAEYAIINSVAEGILELTLVNEKSQELLEHILAKGRRRESPRLVKMYLLGEKSIRAEIYRLAIVAALGARYNKNGEPIMGGIINDKVS